MHEKRIYPPPYGVLCVNRRAGQLQYCAGSVGAWNSLANSRIPWTILRLKFDDVDYRPARPIYCLGSSSLALTLSLVIVLVT